jgi:hypothetical protein
VQIFYLGATMTFTAKVIYRQKIQEDIDDIKELVKTNLNLPGFFSPYRNKGDFAKGLAAPVIFSVGIPALCVVLRAFQIIYDALSSAIALLCALASAPFNSEFASFALLYSAYKATAAFCQVALLIINALALLISPILTTSQIVTRSCATILNKIGFLSEEMPEPQQDVVQRSEDDISPLVS